MSAVLNNRYRILQPIGRGGCGRTFLAVDTHLPSMRRCVIKQLKPLTDDPAACQVIRERFQREAAILERLGRGCDQIPALHAYFAEAGDFYLVQDWVEGRNLRQKAEQEGRFSEGRVRRLLVELLPVLEYTHSRGIVHRDLKPDNVMLRDADGRPVLIDFGAVKEVMVMSESAHASLTASDSIVIGSPGFMPLEQAAGKPVFASDLFSLGLTAIYLLTGKRPQELTDPSTNEISWRKHAPEVSAGLADVLEKAVRPLPHERYVTAREMLEALQTGDGPSEVTVTGPRGPLRAARSRPAAPPDRPDLKWHGPSPPHFGRAGGDRRFIYALIMLALLLTGTGLAVFSDRGDDNSTASAAMKATDLMSEQDGSAGHKSAQTIHGGRASAAEPDGQPLNFKVADTKDGFTSVRDAPTTRSAEMRRLSPGTKIICQVIVKGESLWGTDQWWHCPNAGGYVHSRLLARMD